MLFFFLKNFNKKSFSYSDIKNIKVDSFEEFDMHSIKEKVLIPILERNKVYTDIKSGLYNVVSFNKSEKDISVEKESKKSLEIESISNNISAGERHLINLQRRHIEAEAEQFTAQIRAEMEATRLYEARREEEFLIS